MRLDHQSINHRDTESAELESFAASESLCVDVLESLELPQYAQVVLEQRADVWDVELDHGAAVEAEAEGEAAPLLGVDADVAQHLGVDHAAAEDLHPAG